MMLIADNNNDGTIYLCKYIFFACEQNMVKLQDLSHYFDQSMQLGYVAFGSTVFPRLPCSIIV